jgi:hypothetical protein
LPSLALTKKHIDDFLESLKEAIEEIRDEQKVEVSDTTK